MIMEKIKAIFKKAFLYQKDKMNLPVANVETAIPFYESIFGFTILSRMKRANWRIPKNCLRNGRYPAKSPKTFGIDDTGPGKIFQEDNPAAPRNYHFVNLLLINTAISACNPCPTRVPTLGYIKNSDLYCVI